MCALKRAEGRGGGLCHAGRDMRAERQNSGDMGDMGESAESSGEIGRGHKKSQPDRLPLRLAALPNAAIYIIVLRAFMRILAQKSVQSYCFFLTYANIFAFFCIFSLET